MWEAGLPASSVLLLSHVNNGNGNRGSSGLQCSRAGGAVSAGPWRQSWESQSAPNDALTGFCHYVRKQCVHTMEKRNYCKIPTNPDCQSLRPYPFIPWIFTGYPQMRDAMPDTGVSTGIRGAELFEIIQHIVQHVPSAFSTKMGL